MTDYNDMPSEDREVSALSLPPHSMEAEQSVLGGLLLENAAWDRIADIVNGEDFYRHEHRLIFRVIATLINESRPADVITVQEALERNEELEAACLPKLKHWLDFDRFRCGKAAARCRCP